MTTGDPELMALSGSQMLPTETGVDVGLKALPPPEGTLNPDESEPMKDPNVTANLSNGVMVDNPTKAGIFSRKASAKAWATRKYGEGAREGADFLLVRAGDGNRWRVEPGPQAKKRKQRSSAVSRIRELIAEDLSIGTNEIMETLKAEGLSKSKSTIETIRSDFLQTYRALVAAGHIKKPVRI